MPRRTAGMKRSGKLPAENPEQLARTRAGRKRKHSAYRRSETYRIVADRAGGQCEHVHHPFPHEPEVAFRCTETEDLEHHHLRYNKWRYGGNELPSDLVVLCKWHHRALHPNKRPGRRAA